MSELSFRKVLAITLVVFMVGLCFPAGLLAIAPAAFDIADGNIIIQPGSGDNAGKVSITWGGTPDTVYFEPDAPITITGTTTAYSVSVTDGVNALLVLDDLDIDLSASSVSAAPVSISGDSLVQMIINGENRLIARSNDNSAGLQVNSGNVLTILAASSGELSAVGGSNGAGIGGGNAAGGSITINGGTISATGGYRGAGIGGAGNNYGGTIIINGGIVVAKGTIEGPGIGSGYYYSTTPSAVVQLNGGDITAISGSCGPAGIGGACGGSPADITILSAATVRAVSRSSYKAVQAIGNTLNENSTASVLMANFSGSKSSGTLTEICTKSLAAVINAAPVTPSTYQSIAFTVPANRTYLMKNAGEYQQHTTSPSTDPSTDFAIGGVGLYIFNSVQDAVEEPEIEEPEIIVDPPASRGGRLPINRINDEDGSSVEEEPETEPVREITYSGAYVSGFPDSTFRPAASLTRAQIASMLYRIDGQRVGSGQLNDVSSEHWAFDAIRDMITRQIMNTKEDGRFLPDESVTRGAFAEMLSVWLNLPESSQTGFADTIGHPSEKAISSVRAAGYMSGYPDGLFRPNEMLSRAEVVVVLNAVLERTDENLEVEPIYSDVPINHWANRAIRLATIE